MAAECVDDSGYFASPDFLATTIHWLVCIEAPILVYGGYCIIFKTPEQMKSVKFPLLNLYFWTALSDIVLNITGIFYLLLPTMAGWGLGVVHAPGFLIYSIVTFLAVLAASIIGIYENRFNCFLNPRSWWCRVRKPAMFLVYSVAPFIFLPPYFYLPDQEFARERVLETLPCLLPFHYNDRPLYVLTLDFHLPVMCVASAFIIFGSLTAIFFLLTFWKMFIDKNLARSQKTLQIQKKFAIAMSIQAFFLLLVFGFPVGTGFVVILFGYHSQALNNLLVIFVCLHGIGSTLVMIVVHKPYRDFTLSKMKILCDNRKRNVQSTLNS